MTMKCWMAILLALALGCAAGDASAQTAAPGTQEISYANAMALKDPAKRAEALEVFIAWYPGSPLRIEASEQAMAAWQSADGTRRCWRAMGCMHGCGHCRPSRRRNPRSRIEEV